MPIHQIKGKKLKEKIRIHNRGTPQGLFEAITNGLVDECMSHVSVGVVHSIREAVLDYLAQKFGTEMLKAHANKDLEKALRSLWEDVKGETDEKLSKK